jgi:hypothetical protein
MDCYAIRLAPRVSRRWVLEVAEDAVRLTLGDPPGETTHWTADSMASEVGISAQKGLTNQGPLPKNAF